MAATLGEILQLSLITVVPALGGVAAWLGYDEWRRSRNTFERYEKLRRELEDTLAVHKKRYPLEVSIADLEGHLAELRQELGLLQRTRQQTEDKTLELETVTKRVEALRQEEPALEAKLREIRLKETTYERLVMAYDRLSEEHDEMQADCKALKSGNEDMEREKHALTLALQNVQEEYAALAQQQQAINELKEQRGALNEAITKLSTDKSRLEAEVAHLNVINTRERINIQVALEALSLPVIPKRGPDNPAELSERDFLRQFSQYLEVSGFNFPERLVRAFHTALKIQDISSLLVLAGISGTGKSELPRLYTDFAHLDFVLVPVQPRWDSPQDLLGFYNYMEKQYKPTKLAQALRQYDRDRYFDDRILLVLLDEMNLARVEYYFSDFLSKLEARRNNVSENHLDLDFGNLAVEEKDKRIVLRDNVLYVGTMNEDETTQTLSDKVLDRASVLTFPRPKTLQLQRRSDHLEAPRLSGYLSWRQFSAWRVQSNQASAEIVDTVTRRLTRANEILEQVDRSFAHRVSQAVLAYVLNHPSVAEDPVRGVDEALADQLALKIIAKLRGLPLDENSRKVLRDFQREIVDPLDDALLNAAFASALSADENAYAFAWRGLPYEAAFAAGRT